MEKAIILVTIFVLALLVPALAESVGGSEDFPFASSIRIISPSNSTYSTGSLTLNVSITALMASNINVSLTYVLDGTYNSKIPMAILHRNQSASAVYVGSMPLPELPEGPHRIDVHCKIEIDNVGINGVYYQKYVCQRNATVYFAINTTPSIAPNPPPETQQSWFSMNSALVATAIAMITVAGAAAPLAFFKKSRKQR
ncbi:MAG: hypothetical protein QW146_08310 [Candidatus Bathyarchaeia archaeon]